MLFCQSIKISSTGRAASVVPDFFGLFTKTEQFSAGRLSLHFCTEFPTCLPCTGQYLWAKKERCCGWERDDLTGVSLSARSRCSFSLKLDMHISMHLTYFKYYKYYKYILGQTKINLSNPLLFSAVFHWRLTVHASELPSVLLLFPLASLAHPVLDWKYLSIHQSALAMLGSASGSLCPASPRAAHNLREGWARAAWYFR